MCPGPVRLWVYPVTFYRYKAAVEQGGAQSLFDESRRQPNLKTGLMS